MSLDLPRPLRDPVLGEPARGLELLRVRTPEPHRLVHHMYGYSHELPLRHCDAVHKLSVRGTHRRGEWDHIVFRCLRSSERRHPAGGPTYHSGRLAQRRMEPQRLMHNGIEVGQTVHELVPSWILGGELQELFAQLLLDIRLLAEFEQAPL